MALLLGVLGLLTMPAAVEAARRSDRIALLDAAYAVPLGFLLGLLAVVMGRRARHNLRWLRLREGGTAVASTAIVVGLVSLCLAVTAALSVGFYELVLLYQRSR